MSPKEFLAKHDQVIAEVTKRTEAAGRVCKVLQNNVTNTYKETIMSIENEVYSVVNNGNRTNATFIGFVH